MFSDGPCDPWTPYWTCDISVESPTVTGLALDSATRILWGLSGRQYGVCTVTTRPCRESCFNRWPTATPLMAPWSSWGGSITTSWDASYWFDQSCGSCSGGCACGEVPDLRLPARCSSVSAVRVDGVLLAPTAYRLDDNRLLIRTDGQRWPRCNNLRAADTEPGTWSVTAAYGIDVPESAGPAVGALACQLIRAFQGKDCALPMAVQSLVRQGVTLNFPDINAAMQSGRTGVYLADLWLAAVNPNRLSQRARVYSPDRPPVRRAGS